MPANQKLPVRLKALFANIEELERYAQKHPEFLPSIGADRAELAWKYNPVVKMGESVIQWLTAGLGTPESAAVRRMVERIFERQIKELTFPTILTDGDWDGTDVTVHYTAEDLLPEDRKVLGYRAEIAVVDVVADDTSESILRQLPPELLEKLQETVSEHYTNHEFEP